MSNRGAYLALVHAKLLVIAEGAEGPIKQSLEELARLKHLSYELVYYPGPESRMADWAARRARYLRNTKVQRVARKESLKQAALDQADNIAERVWEEGVG